MGNWRYAAYRLVFEALWASQLAHLVRARSACRGVIFTLHRVLPDDPADFAPNAILQVKPDYLDFVIRRVRQLGFDIVTLEEAVRRLRAPAAERPFIVFSFDDAYRDNLRYALPVLRRHRCPFVLYVPTALVDGVGQVWWQALEDIVAAQSALSWGQGEGRALLPSARLAEKHAAYDHIYRDLRRMPEPRRAGAMAEFAAQYGFDLAAHCRALIMDWAELKTFADEPLCTIGAHTVNHAELALLPQHEARTEMAQSLAILRAQFGTTPRHFSYPVGGSVSAGQREFALAAELGLETAVTTRPGGLYARHAQALTTLPRISLNGLFQSRRHVEVLATGAIFSAMRKDRSGRV